MEPIRTTKAVNLSEKTLPNSKEENKRGGTSAFYPQPPDLAKSEFTGWSIHYNHKSNPRVHVQSMSTSKIELGEHRGEKKRLLHPTHKRQHEYPGSPMRQTQPQMQSHIH